MSLSGAVLMSVEASVVCGACKMSCWIGKLKAGLFCLAEDYSSGTLSLTRFLSEHFEHKKIRIIQLESVPDGYTDIDYSDQ